MENGGNGDTRVFEVLLADAKLRRTRLQRELEELESAEKALQLSVEYQLRAFEKIKAEVNVQALSEDEIRDKSQRAILHLIAERNYGWLVVQPAIKLMVDAGVLPQDTGSAQVYTVLRENPTEFEKVQPGIYRLRKVGDKVVQQAPDIKPASTGLAKEVARLKNEHPNWKIPQLTKELLSQGWNFGDKKPTSSVAMANANLAKQNRNKAKQALLQFPGAS